jgi:hypothetical protein
MGDLTESEIFDCLATNFKLAAEHSEDLAKLPRKGPTYRKLRDELKLLEGACRQAAYWRQDARWFPIGKIMATCHQMAGEWLRGLKQPSGRRVPIAESEKHPLFMMLAESLRFLEKQALICKNGRTGRVGMILPKPQAAPTRTQGRSVPVLLPPGMAQRASGLIVPVGAG